MAASTIATAKVYPFGWSVCASNADWSGTEVIVAAPAAGTSLYLTSIDASADATISVTIGEGAAGGAVTAIAGPLYNSATDRNRKIVFDRPVKLTAATALVADASGAGAVTIVAQGYTR